jgi:RyR domain
LIEVLAKAIHADYARRRRQQGAAGEDSSFDSWETLSEDLRNSNRTQAMDIERKLTAVGYQLTPSPGADSAEFKFTESEVELLAKLEHERWREERLQAGWVLGSTRDLNQKVSPYLVGWDSLTEEVRDLDRETVRSLPRFLAPAGLTIRRAKGSAPEGSRSAS